MEDRMSQRFGFFALRDDSLAIMSRIETKMALEYRRIGVYTSREMLVFTSVSEIPDFGVVVRGETNREPNYLVLPAKCPFIPRVIPYSAGGQGYSVAQDENPSSVVLCSGGLYTPGVIIGGECVTRSRTASPTYIYERFRRVFRRWVKVGDSFVAPLALELARQGARLTHEAAAPVQFDVKLA
jgi:hypothetical protein